MVPDRWPENPQLAQWVGTQRKSYRQRRLDTHKIRRLEEIGFEWNPMRKVLELWERRFSDLIAFKNQRGHCNVPAEWSKNPQLGKWVSNQRGNYKRGTLSAERIKKLEALGFKWGKPPGKK